MSVGLTWPPCAHLACSAAADKTDDARGMSALLRTVQHADVLSTHAGDCVPLSDTIEMLLQLHMLSRNDPPAGTSQLLHN